MIATKAPSSQAPSATSPPAEQRQRPFEQQSILPKAKQRGPNSLTMGNSGHGKVYLVGAGPGDPELITIKGLRCLRRSEVVIYDRLISPLLLDDAPPQAERIFVGKGPGSHSMPQEEINALLVRHGTRGQLVVRLKGGDPFIFGRGGEEAAALAAAGIPFEIVPGISSAIAVPAYAGIPVTHRNLASQVTIVTGHEGCDREAPAVDWEGLARLHGTLVILMGVAALPSLTTRLQAAGMHPSTPAAVIQEGTMPQQRLVTGTLADIADRALTAGLGPPAITVIGAVAALHESLAWFGATLSQNSATNSLATSLAINPHTAIVGPLVSAR